MHVSLLKLWNFRKFGDDGFDLVVPHLEVGFNPGLNVLIGENDSGKTAIIDAVRLVMKTHSYDWLRIDSDDFHESRERLRIELILSGIKPEEGKNFTEFLCWEDGGGKIQPFLRLILDVRKNPVTGQILPYEVRAGGDADGKQLSLEAKEYLKLTYLKPLRDAEEELVAKKNSRLSQILIGHEAFKGKAEGHVLMDHLMNFNLSLENYFQGNDHAGAQIDDQLGKGLKDSIDGYIGQLYQRGKKTGLSVTERGQLKGLLEKLELSILGETRPGLGTLNRLFMASELLHLNKGNWTGIRLGLVEELEAHLHPQAQMQAIETLQKQVGVQLMLTTHSPNVGSKLGLKSLIVCSGGKAYPMGAAHTELDADDYVFLERFLDVTKANLFFSKGVILVEGWSEELFLAEFAKLLGYNLTEKGVAVVNVSNLAFIRYANIFKRKAEPYFGKPVAVLTDVDVPSDEEDGATPGDKANLTAEIIAKQAKYDGQCVKSFISPKWTFEYCLSKSDAFKKKFAEIAKAVHNRTDWTDFDATLADKLKRRALSKTEISARLALAISKGEIDKSKVPGDVHVEYLVKAIKYACGN